MVKARKRRKGAGRKFTDGRISKARFIRSARKWFFLNTSIRRFLSQVGISRQAYYRFMDQHEWLKEEIQATRTRHIENQKEYFRRTLEWMRANPDKTQTDYWFRNL